MKQPKIVFIPTPLRDPITGGEIYAAKLFEFLRNRSGNVESAKIDVLQFHLKANKSHYEMSFIGLRSIIRNFLYVFWVTKKKYYQRTIILEDAYYSIDLFLFNLLLRHLKRNVSVVPMVHHLYHTLGNQRFYRILLKAIETLFLNESDWIIVNSEATEKDVRKLLKETKKILVAHPGIDKEKMVCRSINRKRGSRRLKILTVGSVTKRKDFETLLKAIKVLVDRCDKTDFFVDIVGDLEKDKEFSAKIIETVGVHLSSHVALMGRVDYTKLCDFYAQSDIFVSTSLHEGFGMAIAEAMYNRLPVVATNCGATPYLVQDGVNGFLVPSGDYEQLAQKIARLLESEELRKNMGDKGFCKAKKLDWNRTFGKIYRNLLEA